MRTTIILFTIATLAIVLVTGFWPTISSNILAHTTWGLYSRSFFEDLLVGTHGTLIDLFLIGIVLYWFERRATAREISQRQEAERNIAVQRNIETLADLRYYKGDDLSHRNLTAIKNLIALGVKNIPCPEVKLENLNIERLTFERSNMHAVSFANSKISRLHIAETKCDAAVFINAKLSHVRFDNVSFARAKFCGAQLPGVDFSTCKLERANFEGANLRSAIFRNVDCKGINFSGADLRSANFSGAINLTSQMLSVARNTNYIQK